MNLDEVTALRRRLWAADFRPVPVHNHDSRVDAPGKQPLGSAWQEAARKSPPFCAVSPAVPHAQNTGILGDGLRAIDLDIDDPQTARECRELCQTMLGYAPVRSRAGSARCLLLYAAAEGEPVKLTLAGTRGKIEVLGKGQQFVSYGTHPSGAELVWHPLGPGDCTRADLVVVTETQIRQFLAACAPLLGASVANGSDRHATPQADPLRIAAALADIPNAGPPDWEWWNRVAMAVWRATDGEEMGWQALNTWSARNPAYDPATTRKRWLHYAASPPTQIGAGTIFHLAKEARTRQPGRILDTAVLIAAHRPPDWLIKGIIQRSRLYACTSPTGHGKTAVWIFCACMIQAGRMIGSIDVPQGNVLFLAGENPTDYTARMLGMTKAYNLPLTSLPRVLPSAFPLTAQEAETLKRDIAGLGVPLALIVGDTASSFFPGEDENDNVQAGTYARTLRSLTECEGHPAIVVLSHPTKNAAHGNLLPRGGSAFLNELDGNLTLWSDSPGELTELHWEGKIRGPDFSPVGFKFHTISTGLVDTQGQEERTVFVEPMSEEAVAEHAKQNISNADAVLKALHEHPDWSLNLIARHVGWLTEDDRPERWRVQRTMRALASDKLIVQPRRGAPWTLTSRGEAILSKL